MTTSKTAATKPERLAKIKKYLGPALILALIALRLFSATQLPTFYIDEAARAGLVKAITTPEIPLDPTQQNPLFVRTDAEFSTLPFFGPATIWATFFGTSEISLRIFISITSILGILLLAKTISYYFKKSPKTTYYIAAVIGLTLPWPYLQGLLFWDTTLAPLAIIISLWAFSYLFTKQTKPDISWQIRKNAKTLTAGTFHLAKHLAQILLPTGLILATYLYKPTAFLAILLYIYFLVKLFRSQTYQLKHLILTILGSILLALPLAIFILTNPTATDRTTELSFLSAENPIANG